MSYKPKLEPYNRGRGRHTCPNCGGRKQFAHWIKEDGNYYADNVGICNRRESCGYIYPPRQYYLDNPTIYERKASRSRPKTTQKLNKAKHEKHEKHETFKSNIPDFLDFEILLDSLCNYEQNTFVAFLASLFEDNPEAVRRA